MGVNHIRHKKPIEIKLIPSDIGEAGVLIVMNFTQIKQLVTVYSRRNIQDIYDAQAIKLTRAKQLGFQIPVSEVDKMIEAMRSRPKSAVLRRMVDALEQWQKNQKAC